jgi:dihydrofolate synthase / folylpolyglutamate synthase
LQDPLSYLFSLEQFGIKFGLDNIATLVDRLGHPERAFQSVHVAGTNGKGSVTAMVDAALRTAGHRSARYTSPHLVDLTERFVIDGRPVSEDALVAVVADVQRVAASLLESGTLSAPPTFFEVTTAAAFELFRRAGVAVAVLEVGLGGRLDATNVVLPAVTAITSIAFDHERYLGSTIEAIAFEKAGIIKPGVPVVTGDLQPEAAAVIDRIARERGADVIRTTAVDARGFTIGLPGAHQAGNAAIAVKVLETLDAKGILVPPEAIARGLAQPEWPGRLDRRRLAGGRELLLDAAHNPAGAAALASYLKAERSGPCPLVFAAMKDKDTAGMFAVLLPAVSHLILTRAANPRSADPSALEAQARAISDLPITIAPSPAEALEIAWRDSPRIVVAGSIFLLGDVLKQIERS